MTAAAEDLDLSVLPPEYRVAFEALQATAVRAAELEDIVKRLEHLVADSHGDPGQRQRDEQPAEGVEVRHQRQDRALRLGQHLLRHLDARGTDGG